MQRFNRSEVDLKKTKKLYEGKTKKIYATPEAEQLIVEFKDDSIPGESPKAGIIKGRSAINKDISAHLFDYLEGFNIPTHFLKNLSAKDMLIRRLEMIPIKVTMYNIIAGNLFTHYGFEEGKELACPIIEFYLKNEERHDPMINQSHIVAFNLATMDEVRMIERMTSKINAILKSFFLRRKIILVDFTVEFGRYKNKVLLGDEISPETCRLWDASKNLQQNKDKSPFNADEFAIDYEEIRKRILSSSS